jgi:hypothetical protein
MPDRSRTFRSCSRFGSEALLARRKFPSQISSCSAGAHDSQLLRLGLLLIDTEVMAGDALRTVCLAPEDPGLLVARSYVRASSYRGCTTTVRNPDVTPCSRVQGPARAARARCVPRACGGLERCAATGWLGSRRQSRLCHPQEFIIMNASTSSVPVSSLSTLSVRERSVLAALRPFLGADAEVLFEAQGRSLHKLICFARDSPRRGTESRRGAPFTRSPSGSHRVR